MTHLGFLYQYHYHDDQKALKYYRMAAKQLDQLALEELGSYYEKIQDYSNMVKYYTMAAQQGSGLSMNQLGNYYNDGINYPLAIKYYLQAIALGNSVSMYNLDNYYLIQEDYSLASKYLEMAAEANYPASFKKLHILHKKLADKYLSLTENDSSDGYLSRLWKFIFNSKS